MLNLVIQAKVLVYLFSLGFFPSWYCFGGEGWWCEARETSFSIRKGTLSCTLTTCYGEYYGEEYNIALMLSLWGWKWLCLELASLWLSTICVRNSQSQTKEIGKVFFLSVLQSLKIAIKHLDKISRWWQGKENDQSQALLNPLNITYSLDIAVTRHSLIFGELSGSTFFPCLYDNSENQIMWRRQSSFPII